MFARIAVRRLVDSLGSNSERTRWRPRGRARPTLEVLEAREVPTVFSYPTFADTEGLVLNGSAVQDGNMLNLAGGVIQARGSVFSQTAIQPGKSFTSQFVFQVDPQGSGITFIVQNDPRGVHALGGSGGALGLGEIGGSDVKITPSVGVEFDVFFDEARFGTGFSLPFEPNDNHIGIDTAGGVQMTNPVQPNPGFNLFDQKVKATISYNAETKVLKVFAGPVESRQKLQTSAKIDIGQTVGSQGYVGFSSSTGGGTESHFLLSWKFVQRGAGAVTSPGTSSGVLRTQQLAQGQLLAASLGTDSKLASVGEEEHTSETTVVTKAAGFGMESSKPQAAGFVSSTPVQRTSGTKPLDLGSAFTPDMLVR